MIKISAVVLTKNEENNIEKCLESIRWCDEIIVVDDRSPDGTLEKIKKSQAKNIIIFKRDLNGDFSAQRNYGLQKAVGEWIFFIDADEIVSHELKNEIKKINNGFSAYYIKRRDFFWGRELKYGETAKARNNGIIRLVKKDSGKWFGQVHEDFKVNGQTSRLNGYLDHYPHQTVNEFIEGINYYSSLRAKELFDQKKKANIIEIIIFPPVKFFYTYFTKLGFLDGPAGFVYAFFMSFHSFLVRAKLFQLWLSIH